MATVLWAFLALIGCWLISMGRHVLINPDWENGDWWVLSSWLALRGALFGFLFPVVRTEHTRAQERTNSLLIIGWGTVLFAAGLAMAIYERTR